jgi:hypothetical protein
MSRGLENRFWARVRDMWTIDSSGGHAVRIEASIGGCDPGTPDCVLSCGARGGWVELKVWPEALQPSQLPWHLDAIAHGAYAMVMCELPDRKVWIGSAEDYEMLLQEPLRPDRPTTRRCPEGVDLHRALNMIRCALIGRRVERKT